MIEIAILALLLYLLLKNIDNTDDIEKQRENVVANALKGIKQGQSFILPKYTYIYYTSKQFYGRVEEQTQPITVTALSDAREAQDGAIEVDISIDFGQFTSPPKLSR
jgi:hypothetical protein